MPALRCSAPLLASLLLGCTSLGLYQPPPGAPPLERERFEAPANVLRVAWSRSLVERSPLLEYLPQQFGAAAVGDQMVYVGSSYKTFVALRRRDGGTVWEHKLTGELESTPLYLPAGAAGSQALVVVGDDDGALTALNAQTGQVRWTYRVRGPIRVQPTLSNGLLYFTSGEGRLYAIDATTGAWRWQYEREVPENFTIRGQSGVLAAGSMIYAGFPDGYLAALNGASGEVQWTQKLSGDATRFTDVDSTPVLWRGTLVVSSYAGGVYGLDQKDGSIRWRYELDSAGPVAVDPASGRVYVTAARAGVHCLDAEGHLLWRQALGKQGELSSPTLNGPFLLLTAAAGGMYVIDARRGQLLQFFGPGQGITGRPVIAGQWVYVLSNAGVFFALTAA